MCARSLFHAPAGGDAGFTLIEVMAALTIFSVSILALTRGVTNSVRVAGDIEQRALASIVAENQIALARTDPSFLLGTTETRRGESLVRGVEFTWRAEREDTPAPDLFEVTVSVSDPAEERLLIERITLVTTIEEPTPIDDEEAPDGEPGAGDPGDEEPGDDPDDAPDNEKLAP